MKKRNIMTVPIIIAFWLNILLILTGFIFGIKYIFTSELLNYHLAALGVSNWTEVIPSYKPMLLSFTKVAGIGMTSISFALTFILFNGFRNRRNWSRWALLCLFLCHYIPLSAVMLYLKMVSQAEPPIFLNIVAILISLIAFFLSSGIKKYSPNIDKIIFS